MYPGSATPAFKSGDPSLREGTYICSQKSPTWRELLGAAPRSLQSAGNSPAFTNIGLMGAPWSSLGSGAPWERPEPCRLTEAGAHTSSQRKQRGSWERVEVPFPGEADAEAELPGAPLPWEARPPSESSPGPVWGGGSLDPSPAGPPASGAAVDGPLPLSRPISSASQGRARGRLRRHHLHAGMSLSSHLLFPLPHPRAIAPGFGSCNCGNRKLANFLGP